MATISRGLQGIAVIAAAQICVFVGCNQTPPADGSGGAPPATGGSSSGGASSGGQASGGSGGAEVDCNDFGSPPDCGTCTQTVDEYCAFHDCSLPEDLICVESLLSRSYSRGCGYLRRDQSGDVGDVWVTIWSESTEEIVYAYFSGGLSAGCLPEMFVGTEPECDSYVDACDGMGGGGAGGEGGP